jgi:hypothetical protein
MSGLEAFDDARRKIASDERHAFHPGARNRVGQADPWGFRHAD